MKTIPTGHTCEYAENVTQDKLASSVGSGLLQVYSTPSMIALMERTASTALQPFLDEGENSVGTEVNIRHLKATPEGMQVRCVAEVKEVEGRKVVFSLEASDEKGIIGSGVHTRFVIDTERFLAKLK
jgi:predicted thioesterase